MMISIGNTTESSKTAKHMSNETIHKLKLKLGYSTFMAISYSYMQYTTVYIYIIYQLAANVICTYAEGSSDRSPHLQTYRISRD